MMDRHMFGYRDNQLRIKSEVNDVLEKIKAEIEDLTRYCWEVSPRTVIDDVLAIINKYKAESGDE